MKLLLSGFYLVRSISDLLLSVQAESDNLIEFFFFQMRHLMTVNRNLIKFFWLVILYQKKKNDEQEEL